MRNSDVLKFSWINGARQTARYKNLIFELYSGVCTARGSLHKYKNDGKHNKDDFRLSDFIRVVGDMSATFDFNPEVTLFSKLEFGVNIELPFNPKVFTDSVIYYNNGKIERTSKGIVIRFSEYVIKIYAKDTETPTGDGKNILRYEIGFNKTRRLKKAISKNGGVFLSTLSDLANPVIWRLFGDELLNVYDNLLIDGGVDISTLSTNDSRLYANGCKPGYWNIGNWYEGEQGKPAKTRLKNKRDRGLKRFKNLLKSHSKNTISYEVRKLISEKINQLINVPKSQKVSFGKGAEMMLNHKRSVLENRGDLSQNRSQKKGAEMMLNPNLDNMGFSDGTSLTKATGEFSDGTSLNHPPADMVMLHGWHGLAPGSAFGIVAICMLQCLSLAEKKKYNNQNTGNQTSARDEGELYLHSRHRKPESHIFPPRPPPLQKKIDNTE